MILFCGFINASILYLFYNIGVEDQLIKISLITITLSEVTNSLRVIYLKISFIISFSIFSCLGAEYSDSLTSISLLTYAPSILMSFKNFSGILRPHLFLFEDVDIESA